MDISTIIALAAAAAAVLSCILTLTLYAGTVSRDRKRDTLQAYNNLQQQALDCLNRYRPEQIREIAKDNKSEEYKTISGYVARIEHFCVGVNQKIYDRKVVYQLAHGYLDSDTIRKRIEPIIERKQTGAAEDYYANTKSVLDWMRKRGEQQYGRTDFQSNH